MLAQKEHNSWCFFFLDNERTKKFCKASAKKPCASKYEFVGYANRYRLNEVFRRIPDRKWKKQKGENGTDKKIVKVMRVHKPGWICALKGRKYIGLFKRSLDGNSVR